MLGLRLFRRGLEGIRLGVLFVRDVVWLIVVVTASVALRLISMVNFTR